MVVTAGMQMDNEVRVYAVFYDDDDEPVLHSIWTTETGAYTECSRLNMMKPVTSLGDSAFIVEEWKVDCAYQ